MDYSEVFMHMLKENNSITHLICKIDLNSEKAVNDFLDGLRNNKTLIDVVCRGVSYDSELKANIDSIVNDNREFQAQMFTSLTNMLVNIL